MKKLSPFLIPFGILAIFTSLLIFTLTFLPVFKAEVGYTLSNPTKNAAQKVNPVDEEFGIVIPKIGANSKVISSVDPYNENEYQRALTRGVAHAKGTALPGEDGNVFIFSHSSVNFYEAARYNSVFYLLSKLEKGDEITLFYQKQKYMYQVIDKTLADPGDLSYLTKKTSEKILTLMTCWPPGTTFKRLIVTARISPVQ